MFPWKHRNLREVYIFFYFHLQTNLSSQVVWTVCISNVFRFEDNKSCLIYIEWVLETAQCRPLEPLAVIHKLQFESPITDHACFLFLFAYWEKVQAQPFSDVQHNHINAFYCNSSFDLIKKYRFQVRMYDMNSNCEFRESLYSSDQTLSQAFLKVLNFLSMPVPHT